MKERQKRNNSGFTLVEVMVVTAISSIMIISIYAVLVIGQSSWFDADTSIELQQNIRNVLGHVIREVRESGYDKDGISQVIIFNGGGIGTTDAVRFSIPVICESTGSIIDENGDVAHWGASLTWGCIGSVCMDADDDCSTVDYKYIEYLIDGSNRLIRRVLKIKEGTEDEVEVVKADTFASNIVDFQATKSADGNVITLQIVAQKTSVVNRTLTVSEQMNVYLRNRG